MKCITVAFVLSVKVIVLFLVCASINCESEARIFGDLPENDNPANLTFYDML